MKKNTQLNIAPFDASDYLDNEETRLLNICPWL